VTSALNSRSTTMLFMGTAMPTSSSSPFLSALFQNSAGFGLTTVGSNCSPLPSFVNSTCELLAGSGSQRFGLSSTEECCREGREGRVDCVCLEYEVFLSGERIFRYMCQIIGRLVHRMPPRGSKTEYAPSETVAQVKSGEPCPSTTVMRMALTTQVLLRIQVS